MNKAYNYLWTGESVFCVCSHRVEEHVTTAVFMDCFGKDHGEFYCKQNLVIRLVFT